MGTIDNPESTGGDGAIDHALKFDALSPMGRLLYASSNGDSWHLIRDAKNGVAMMHVPNDASGGRAESLSVAEFLTRGSGPEQQELFRLLGTLIDQA